MNILAKFLKRIGKPKNEMTLSSSDGWHGFFVKNTSSGKAVNEFTAMQTSAVYACVKVLAETVASLPLHVAAKDADGGKTHETEHALHALLHDAPNPEMTSFTFRETLMAHLLLWGNAYAQIIRDYGGRPEAIYPLLPKNMRVERDESNRLVYHYNKDDGGEVRLQSENVLHIPGLGFDGLVGYSPIAMARNAIGLSIAAEEFGAKFFVNGAVLSGVLEYPGTLTNIEKIKESWNSQFKGSENAHKIGVLEDGLKFKPTGIPPEDAQFLETRRFQKNDIASIFRVPPHMIGDLEKSSFSNIEQMSLEFVKYTLNPWIVRWEQSLKRALIMPSEKSRLYIAFNLDGLLRGDYESRIKGYSTGIQNGFYSVNDVRRLEDMRALSDEEGGNLHFVNGNMVKLKDVGAAYEKNNSGERSEET